MDQQHTDLEPLLLAMAQQAGRFAAVAGKPDARQGRLDPLALVGGQPREQGAPGAAAVGQRQFEVLEYGQVLEHGRPLEFPADAEIGDVGLVEPGQILVAAKKYFTGIRAGLAGHDIHHRCLARAVRADDRSELALLDDERQIVKRLEAVEADRDAVQVQQNVAGRTSGRGVHVCFSAATGGSAAKDDARRGRGHGNCRNIPTMPRGKTSVVSTNSPPRKNSQISGTAPVSQVFARLTSTAPIAAPISVPRPPTDTQIATSIELPGENSLGLMMPTCGT